MKRTVHLNFQWCLRLCFPLCLLWVSNLFAETNSDSELRVITEDWPPYNYQENGVIKGFSTEIVRAMMAYMNTDAKITLLPGARGEWLLDNTDNIINFSLFRSPSRENKYQWIGPIADETIYFFKHSNSPVIINSIEDARHYKVGSLNTGFVHAALIENGFTNIDVVSDQKSLPRMLVNDRIELMANLPLLGNKHMIRQSNLPKNSIENTGVVLAKLPLYLAASKNLDPTIVAQWQQALDAIKTSGEYQQIFDRYMQEK